MYEYFWTDNINEMVPIPCVIDEWSLFLGSLLVVHYSTSMTSCIFFISMERLFASYYLNDYEKRSRRHISVLIIAISVVVSWIVSIIFTANILNFVAFYTISAFVILISVLMYYLIWVYNKKIAKRMSTSFHYSLAKRFQTKENLLALKLTRRVSMVIFSFLFIFFTILLITYNSVTTFYWKYFMYSMDTVVNIYPIILCPVVLTSVDDWKHDVLQELPFLKLLVKTSKVAEKSVELQIESQKVAHFTQLSNVWI
ncbi:unnamed protein product [Caenorhabditis bovis]|uniref:Uncharacterized protein n=1 Tax=Caenorhabditis bovis TaxID=2654633 RepID=A0A8S1F038_9PELO|nr:unnamed protein product [Caenorhabditis bovis]